MTARKQRMAAKEARTRQKRQTDRREEEKVPPMPKGSRRDGIPDRGPLPHGEESARPKDSGRHGA